MITRIRSIHLRETSDTLHMEEDQRSKYNLIRLNVRYKNSLAIDKFPIQISALQKSNLIEQISLPIRIMMPRGKHREGDIEIREVRSVTPARVKKKFQCTPYSPTCSCANTLGYEDLVIA